MAWTAKKSWGLAGIVVLLAGLAVFAKRQYAEHRRWMWRVQDPTQQLIAKTPPQVTIVRTKFAGARWVSGPQGMVGIGQNAKIMVSSAYGQSSLRTIYDVPLPLGRYDFISNVSSNQAEALQAEIKKQLGVIARREKRTMNVMLLKVHHAHAPDLQPSAPEAVFSERTENGESIATKVAMRQLAGMLGFYFDMPVYDETGLEGNYDIHLKLDWRRRNAVAMKRNLIDQLGLELVPTRRPVEVLVVEKAK